MTGGRRGFLDPVTVVLEPGAAPKPGDRIELGLAPDRVHLFDLRTGSAI